MIVEAISKGMDVQIRDIIDAYQQSASAENILVFFDRLHSICVMQQIS